MAFPDNQRPNIKADPDGLPVGDDETLPITHYDEASTYLVEGGEQCVTGMPFPDSYVYWLSSPIQNCWADWSMSVPAASTSALLFIYRLALPQKLHKINGNISKLSNLWHWPMRKYLGSEVYLDFCTFDLLCSGWLIDAAENVKSVCWRTVGSLCRLKKIVAILFWQSV